MKKLSQFLIVILFNLCGYGQNANPYVFATGTGVALEPMTSGTTELIAGGNDDVVSAITNIGFTFKFGSTNFTTFSVNSNGVLKLGSPVITTGYSLNTNTNNPGKIAPYATDLVIPSGSKIHYKVTGSAPNQRLVIEWQAVRYGSINPVKFFQVWLYASSNIIQFVYQDMPAITIGGYAVGIANADTDFRSVTTSNHTSNAFTVNSTQLNAIALGRYYRFTPAATCSGTPPAPVISGPAEVCANATFTMAAASPPTAAGIRYAWQKSSNGTTFTNIPGENGIFINTIQTTPTYYRLVDTCSVGNQRAASNVLLVNIKPSYNCLCASGADSVKSGEVLNVTVGSLNQSSTCSTTGTGSGSILNRYSDYTSGAGLPAAPDLARGTSIPFSVTVGTCNGLPLNYGVVIFIDFDKSGDFDETEKVYSSASTNFNNHISNGSFNIPLNVSTGLTGMRIIGYESENANAPNPCNNFSYGETEDYRVNITAGTSCSGAITAGSISSLTTACSGQLFMLTNTGATSGSNDIRYAWQSSTNGVNFTNIPGQTGLTAYVSQTANRWYRFVDTCVASGQTAISNVLQINMTAIAQCYCSSVPSNAGYIQISKVALGTLISNSICNTTGTSPYSVQGKYSDYTFGVNAPAAPDLRQGISFPFEIDLLSCSGGSTEQAVYSIWIDYNKNAAFEDDEKVYTSSSFGTRSIIIPTTATTGITRMRIVMVINDTPYPCFSSSYGETEDYLVNITSNSQCTGTPAAGIISGPSAVCPGQYFNISGNINQVSGSLNMGYRYQVSSDGINFNNIEYETSPIADYIQQNVNSFYRRIDTCRNTGLTSISNVLYIGLSPFPDCYCSSAPAEATEDEILKVTIGSLVQSSTCSTTGTGPSSILNKYSDYKTGTGAPAAPEFARGAVIPFSIQTGNCTSGMFENAVAIWIDLNRNGIYEATEKLYSSEITQPSGHTETGSISIPFNIETGITAMRIICSSSKSTDPCGNYNYGFGETEDYMVDITTGEICTGVPAAPRITGPSNVVSGENFQLKNSNPAQANNITYRWQKSVDGISFTNIINGISDNIQVTQFSPTYYRLLDTCINSGLSSQSNILFVDISTSSAYCPSYFEALADEEIFNVTFGTLIQSSNCNTTAPGPGSFKNRYSNYTSGIGAPDAPILLKRKFL